MEVEAESTRTLTELTVCGYSIKKRSERFCEIHRKTLGPSPALQFYTNIEI